MNFTNLKNFIDTLPAYGIPSSDVIVYRDHKEIWRHAVGEPLRVAVLAMWSAQHQKTKYI